MTSRPFRDGSSPTRTLSDRVAAAEQLFHKTLAEDRDALTAGAVAPIEVAPLDHAKTDCFEEPGRDGTAMAAYTSRIGRCRYQDHRIAEAAAVPGLRQRDAGARHTRQRVDAAQHLTVVGVVVDVRVGTGRAASGYATKTLPLRSMPVSSAWSSDRLRISAAVARSTSDIASCVATMSRRYGWCGSSSVRRHEWLRRPCLACRARAGTSAQHTSDNRRCCRQRDDAPIGPAVEHGGDEELGEHDANDRRAGPIRQQNTPHRAGRGSGHLR